MQRIYRSFLFIIIFALTFQPLKGAGLLFSRDTPQTYLDLFSGNYISFSNSVTITFDLSILNHESFGQIWVYEDKNAPYSFAYIGRDKSSSSFVINSLTDKKQFLEIAVSPQAIGARKWLHVETRLDFQQQKAEVTIDGQKYLLDGISIPNPSKANIIFGANRKAIPEVPTMIIKNILIRDEASHTFLFPLTESDGEVAHETGNKLLGTVVNPTWQINKQFFWQKIKTFNSSPSAGIDFDESRRQILLIGDNNIKKFDIDTLKLTEYQKETVGVQMMGYSGEAIYNPNKQETYFYNLADIAGQTRPFFSTIPDKDSPAHIISPKFSNPLHHHAYFFDRTSQSLYIFGGYGNYKYSNQVYQYNFDNEAWKEIPFSGDSIYPRMHTVAGNGPIPGSFYVFGGVGNETGKQELGKDFFCDLYLFDTAKRTIKKLWSRPFPENYFIPTRGLVFDSKKDYIYLLCIDRTTTNLSLHRFDVKTGEHAVVSNEIPFKSTCILSTAYLFNNPKDNELYAVVRYSEDNNPEATISIYKLNAPPITYQELKKWHTDDESKTGKSSLYFIIAGVILLLIFCTTAYYRYKRKSNKKENVQDISENVVLDKEESFSTPQLQMDIVNNTPIKVNAIYLLGDFQVFDAKGNEIAYRFGPKIKQMFVLVLLHSHDGQEGISTAKLSAQLWPEKTTTAAKNIRNVTINHLRGILTDLEEMELVFSNDKWKIVYGNNFYCDYLKALSIAKTLQQSHSPQEEDIKQLTGLLQRGTLLPPFVHYEWFGNIKINHDELFIRIIEKLLPTVEANNEPRKVIVLADILFSFDGMSETALIFKTKALKKLGQKVYAQSVYERFQKEYQHLYGEKYKENSLEE